MKSRASLSFSYALWGLAFVVALRADPLIVPPGSTVPLGTADSPTTSTYDSLVIESGGTLDLQGDMTLFVNGDIVIHGTISRTPNDKAPMGNDGADGAAGLDNQPTGQNVGLGGQFPGTAPGWTMRAAPRLTLRASGDVLITGTIRLEPAYDGGDGGRGGHGGRGGSGISAGPGAQGGGGSQGGQGGAGGHALVQGSVLRISGQRVDLAPSGRIYLDSKSVGGKGGVGGNGGNGGAGGNGIEATSGGHGGHGGPPGSGGTGGPGGAGGTVVLSAQEIVVVDGEISVKGGDGGEGGSIGTPGSGGDGGDAGPADNNEKRGGNGGHAGGPSGPGGFAGGRGGPGGFGGQLQIEAPAWSLFGIVHREGGKGGKRGPGVTAARTRGGAAGSPNGVPGMDSPAHPDGQEGANGREGRILFSWTPGTEWEVEGPIPCVEPFAETLADGRTLRGVKLCAGNCLARFVNTTPDRPYELSFDCRFLTTAGTLDFRMGGQLVHSMQAPAEVGDQFVSIRVPVTDPDILNSGFQELRVCLLSPAAPAMARIANIEWRPAPTASPPVVSIRLVTGQSPLEFSWPSIAGHSYQIQTRLSLTSGDWANFGAPMTGTGETLTATATIPAGQPEAYYRVVATGSP